MADVGSIRFAIMMLILARTVLSRLLQPRARGVLWDEGAFLAIHARQRVAPARSLQRNPLSNEINELTLTKP
jgi:hypothetical protein